ncbi:MAG: M14 family zinc carboxypeptidase [Gemmatimonadota bacterium]
MRSSRFGDAARTLFLALLAVLTYTTSGSAQQEWTPPQAGYPQTAAELNGFTAHTRHLEMWDYLEQLRGVAPNMRLGSYGETREGRKLPFAVFGNPLVTEPWEAMALDRPVLLLAANVHGGERTFREGLLVLMRDFATPGTDAYALLDDVTVLVAPQINPDGFEASEGGQRGNAWGIDLNRDYVKLEHPSIESYVRNLIRGWRPHLYVDGHNGGSRPYNLNYQCPSIINAMQEITRMCDEEIFPAIDAMLEGEDLLGWYYTRGDEEEWRVGGWQARIGRNYGGMINSVGILFEAPSQDLGTGARAGYLGYLAVVDWAARNPERLKDVIARANAETIDMGANPTGQVAVRQEYEHEDYTVDYLLVEESNGGFDTIQVTGARILKKPVATRFRDRAWAYVLPRDAEDAVDLLLRHGITVERLTAPATLDVQAYTVGSVSHEPQYNHAAATMVEVGEVLNRQMDFPVGTYVVPTAQNLGRLVAHMLEVETEDNVVYWNTMDAWLPRPGTVDPEDGPPLVPIYKILSPTTLTSHLVDESP